ncbi:MAG: restriction endonuclease subunit S [Prevotella sp.]|nr:restriction endonuclease subunit S [Prevotella sp.]
MSEWKEKNITDVCDTISDTYRNGADKVILINTSDVLEGKVTNHKLVPNQNLAGQFKKTFRKDDILYSEIRPSNRRYAYVDFEPKDYIASTKLMVLRSKPCVLPKYLYYLLTNNTTIRNLHTIAVGRSGTFPQITYSELANIKFLLPSIEEQEKILAILLDIDDKIAVNRRICENLEAQAQALFKHWFIDFAPFKNGKFVESELGMIPEGWRVGTLGDIAVITMGQSPAGSSYNEKGEGVIFYQGRTEFGFRYPSVRLYTTEPKRFAEPLSTLLSVRAPVGDINVATERCCIGRGLASIKSNNNCHSYIFYLLQSMKRRFDVYNGEGTVFGSINKDTLNGLKIFIPNNTIISDFEEIVEEIDKKILESHQESSRLSALRDTLLPKLMSGEIKV